MAPMDHTCSKFKNLFPTHSVPNRLVRVPTNKDNSKYFLAYLAIKDIKFIYSTIRSAWVEKDIYKTLTPIKSAEEIQTVDIEYKAKKSIFLAFTIDHTVPNREQEQRSGNSTKRR